MYVFLSSVIRLRLCKRSKVATLSLVRSALTTLLALEGCLKYYVAKSASISSVLRVLRWRWQDYLWHYVWECSFMVSWLMSTCLCFTMVCSFYSINLVRSSNCCNAVILDRKGSGFFFLTWDAAMER